MTIQDRLKANAERAEQIKALHASAEGRDLNEAEQRQWEDLNATFDAEKDALARDQRIEDRNARSASASDYLTRSNGLPAGTHTTPPGGARNESAINDSVINAALRGWAAGPRARAEDLGAARRLGLNLESNTIELRLNPDQGRTAAEVRANTRATMNGVEGSAGGFLVVPQFASSFDEAMLEYDDMRTVADVIRTDTGAPMYWPGGDDTSNSGEWIAVDQSVSNQNLSFVGQQFGAHTVSSKSVLVDRALLQDASYNLVNRIGTALGTRIGRAMAAAHTTGTGVGQPTGIVTSSYLGKTTAATSIKFDEVMDLISSVGTAYARNGRFMMHRLIKWELRKIKDGNGRYLWEPNLQGAGNPDTVLGYQIVENSNMASTVTSGAKVMLFGDMSYYKIRDVASVTIQRLVEKYAETNQDAFIAFARTDGMLLNSGQAAATKPVKHMVLA